MIIAQMPIKKRRLLRQSLRLQRIALAIHEGSRGFLTHGEDPASEAFVSRSDTSTRVL